MPIMPDIPKTPVVFENTSTSSQGHDSFFWGSIFLAIGWAPVAIKFVRPSFSDGEVLVTFVVAGLCFYLFAIYQVINPQKQRDRRVALIFDSEGIGGLNLFNNVDERLSWMRIRSIEIDGAAVVVQFIPKDMTSENPTDRRSSVRLSVYHREPDELASAIKGFWTPAN